MGFYMIEDTTIWVGEHDMWVFWLEFYSNLLFKVELY